jgi:hypothetical protein
MTLSNGVIISGLIFNTVASIVAIYPFLITKRNVDDDFITQMDVDGNYTQKKHLKDRRLGIFAFLLFALGFILQIVGMAIG